MRNRRNSFNFLPTTAAHRFPVNPTPSSSSRTGSLIQPPPPYCFQWYQSSASALSIPWPSPLLFLSCPKFSTRSQHFNFLAPISSHPTLLGPSINAEALAILRSHCHQFQKITTHPSTSEPVADLPCSPSANSKWPHSESSTWDFQSVMPKEIMMGKQKKPMIQDNAFEASLRILREARMSPIDLLIAVFDCSVDSSELYRNELFKEENTKFPNSLIRFPVMIMAIGSFSSGCSAT